MTSLGIIQARMDSSRLPRKVLLKLGGRSVLERVVRGARAGGVLDELATEHHRVHVTSYIYTHPDDFDVIGLTPQPDLSHLRLTLDTEDDWKVIEAIVDHFGDERVELRTLAAWLADRPDLLELNA